MEEVNGRMFASINVMFSKHCLSWFITTNRCKLVQQLSQDLPLLVVQLVTKEWSTVMTVPTACPSGLESVHPLCCLAPPTCNSYHFVVCATYATCSQGTLPASLVFHVISPDIASLQLV